MIYDANRFDYGLLTAAQGSPSKIFTSILASQCQGGQITFRHEGTLGLWYIMVGNQAVAGTRYLVKVAPGLPVTLSLGEAVEGDYYALCDTPGNPSAGPLHWFRSWRDQP